MNQFERAKKQLRDAEKAFLRASIKEFPVGCVVQWKHGKYTRKAIVTGHSRIVPRVSLKNCDGVCIRPKDAISLTRARGE